MAEAITLLPKSVLRNSFETTSITLHSMICTVSTAYTVKQSITYVKFRFSEKATKIWCIFHI